MKIRNTLGDLNNHLFMQLERLNDEDIKVKSYRRKYRELKQSLVSRRIISNGSLVLKAKTFTQEYLVHEGKPETRKCRTC